MNALPPLQAVPTATQESMSYIGYIGLAFAGSFLRANKWKDDGTGRIIWFRVLTEVPTAIAVGAVAVGIGTYYKLDPKIIGGVSGVLGLLGPAFFTAAGDTILGIIKSKLGNG